MRLSSSSNRPSTLEAYRRVLRFIHRKGGAEGMKLPPQSELIVKLKVCAATLDVAMKWLIEDGVLTRKQRLGTFVLHAYPEAPKRFIWRAGLVMPPITRSYFGAVVAHYLHKHINGVGISDRTYMLSPHAAPGSEVSQRSTSDFTGLKEDIEDGFLDAIITSTRLVCNKVPVCGAAALANTKFGTIIDQPHFFRQAAGVLSSRGYRNLLCIQPSSLDERCTALVTEQLDLLKRDLHHSGVRLSVAEVSNSSGSQTWPERQFVKQLLDLPESQRPDALIIQDDISAQAISLLLSATPYRPGLSALTNLQMPLTFGLPCIPFSIDLEQIAVGATQLLLEKLLSPRCPDRTIAITPDQLQETNPSPYDWHQSDRLISHH